MREIRQNDIFVELMQNLNTMKVFIKILFSKLSSTKELHVNISSPQVMQNGEARSITRKH